MMHFVNLLEWSIFLPKASGKGWRKLRTVDCENLSLQRVKGREVLAHNIVLLHTRTVVFSPEHLLVPTTTSTFPMTCTDWGCYKYSIYACNHTQQYAAITNIARKYLTQCMNNVVATLAQRVFRRTILKGPRHRKPRYVFSQRRIS